MIFDPEATATYCLLSKTYVIGDAFQTWCVRNIHSVRPVDASAAENDPLSSPKNTSPPAVASVPPQLFSGPTCGNSHAMAPVLTSIARKTFFPGSSGNCRVEPS